MTGREPSSSDRPLTGDPLTADARARAAQMEEAMLRRARRGLRLFGDLWLALMLLSGAAASLLFSLLVAPMTAEGFRKAELDTPALVAWAVEARPWLVTGVGIVTLTGLAAVFMLKRPVPRLLTWGACVLLLFGWAVLSILGWWAAYIGQIGGGMAEV